MVRMSLHNVTLSIVAAATKVNIRIVQSAITDYIIEFVVTGFLWLHYSHGLLENSMNNGPYSKVEAV